MKRLFYSVLMAAFAVTYATARQVDKKVVVDFEEAPIELFNNEGFYIGDDKRFGEEPDKDKTFYYSCNYELGPLEFYLNYIVNKKNPKQIVETWNGVSMSKVEGNDPHSILAEHMSVSGGGYKGSKTFGVVTGHGSSIYLKKGYKFQSICLSNNVKALNIMKNGIRSGKGKFKEGDNFKIGFVFFQKTHQNNKKLVTSHEVTLAEFKNGRLEYEKDWKTVDLSSIPNEVDEVVVYSVASPEDFNNDEKKFFDFTRFCIDNITVVEKGVAKGIERVDNGRSEAHEVARYDAGGNRLTAPQKGLNIVRMSDGNVRKVVVR